MVFMRQGAQVATGAYLAGAAMLERLPVSTCSCRSFACSVWLLSFEPLFLNTVPGGDAISSGLGSAAPILVGSLPSRSSQGVSTAVYWI